MDDLLEEQGLWDSDKQRKFADLQQELLDGEKSLAKGGISLRDAKGLALKMKQIRAEIRELIGVRTSLDNHSAEGQADNARFNYLVSACVVYRENNQPYFKNLEDYMNRADDPAALAGAQKLASMIYGLDNNFEKTLPENKFLQKYKFVDDKLRLVDKQGRLVDAEGRLIDENNRYIDEQGNFVDKNGNRVDADGDYLVDAKPFLDDDGNPVVLDEDKPVAKEENKDEAKTSTVTEASTKSETPSA
jgi:hypothetical protein